MSSFADMLTQLTATMGGGSTTVVDMTGLQGHYVVGIDISLADLMRIAQTIGVVPQARKHLAPASPLPIPVRHRPSTPCKPSD
jgi:hypothetical protein